MDSTYIVGVTLRIASALVEANPASFPASVERAPQVLDSTNVVDVTFEPAPALSPSVASAAPATSSAPADAAMDVILTLQSERRASLGGYNHLHVDGACPFCRRAVAAYR